MPKLQKTFILKIETLPSKMMISEKAIIAVPIAIIKSIISV